MCIGTGLRLFFGYFMPRSFGGCVQCNGTGEVEEIEEGDPDIDQHGEGWKGGGGE